MAKAAPKRSNRRQETGNGQRAMRCPLPVARGLLPVSCCFLGSLTLALAVPSAAQAVEWTSAAQVGYGRRFSEAPEHLLALGAHADVVFGRETFRDFGWGPHLGFSAPDLGEMQVDAGLSVLLPVGEAFPIVVSMGPWVGTGEGQAGALGRVFWGARPVNAHAAYVTTIGVFFEGKASLVGDRGADLSAGLAADGFALLYPFVVLWESIFHGLP